MRVLQVTDGYPPAIGGLEIYVAALSRALVGLGHEVTVATLAIPGAPLEETVDGVEIRRLRGIPQHLPGAGHDLGRLFHPPVPDPSIAIQLQTLVDTMRPDVIHGHGWMMNSCLPLRRGSTALVAHLHDEGLSCIRKTMWTDDGPCRLGPGVARCTACASGFYRSSVRAGLLAGGLRASRALLGRVDAFVATSASVGEVAATVVPHPERIAIVPPGLPDELFVETRNNGAPEWLPVGPFILFAGALGPMKGVDVLLRAHARSMSGLSLVLLGTRRHDTPEISGGDVIVRANLEREEVMVCWRRATIGVVPSLAEPFGQVAVECQAAGTPVVVSRTGGLTEIVTDGVDGLVVEAGDSDGLADAIDRLAADPELRERLGAAGRRNAERFRLSTTLPDLLAIYEEARARRHGTLSRRRHAGAISGGRARKDLSRADRQGGPTNTGKRAGVSP